MDVEYDAYTSSMDELKLLEDEFSCMLVWSTPSSVKTVISRIAIKVHKDPKQDLRPLILTEIASRKSILKGFLTICEESSDTQLLSNIVLILRESVTPRAAWRPMVLTYLIQNSGTEIMTNLLIKLAATREASKPKQTVSNHTLVSLFWTMSALATRDINFSAKVRGCNCMKLLVGMLSHLSNTPVQLYAPLQCMKALSRNTVSAALLGRHGAIPVIVDIVSKLSGQPPFGPKLKVASEVLASLSKAKSNQVLIVRQKIVGELLDLLCRQTKDADNGKIAAKIASAILTIFFHLAPSKSGSQQFLERGGIGVLRHFCLTLDTNEQRWDRLLCRACTVLSQQLCHFPKTNKKNIKVNEECCQGKPLPIQDDFGPVQFPLPKDFQNIVVDESPSDSTSRETTPDSDDECDDNEEEDFAEADQVAFVEESLTNTRLPSIKRRTKEDLQPKYESFFRELRDSKVVDMNCDNDNNNSTFLKAESYSDCANQTHGLMKFVKIAYPDFVGAKSAMNQQPEMVLEKNRKDFRSKLIYNIKTLLNEISEEDWTVAYDLDQLILNEKLENTTNGNHLRIGNDDEFQIRLSSKSPETKAKRLLKFESRFESGNLRKAVRISGREYNLILSPDVNSKQQLQWFYFQVSNMSSGHHSPYTFNIVNYEKANSQYNFGMQPVMFSVKEAMLGRPYWRRVGVNISYYRNHFNNPSHAEKQNYMTVSFSVTFPHDSDICYLAYHYPYTYSRLTYHLGLLRTAHGNESESGIHFRVESLTTTLNSHDVPVLTITAARDASKNQNVQNTLNISDRRVVFLTARVHPGETNSSWVMEGVLDFLTGQTCEAKELRNSYVFKIIPMLNVEGTINGCHRGGLTGEDLNRRWQSPNEIIHPEIYHTKGLLSYINTVMNKDTFLFCDFHGHSRKKNVFLYGCSSEQSWWSSDREFEDDPGTYMELADIFSTLEETFDLKSCRYQVEMTRESTARVVVWREFHVPRSYTLEVSFCGCSKGELGGQQMSTNMLTDVGQNFCRSLLYLDPNCHDDQNPCPGIECRASVETDAAMRITRLVISMPHS